MAKRSALPQRASAADPAIRIVLLPKDTNPQGTIFGGVILSYIDIAAAIEVRKYTTKAVVTKAMREVEFVQPVFVGDLVSFYTQLVRIGKTSITVRVVVEAQRIKLPRENVRVTEAEVIYVAVDEQRKPVAV